uniref:Uncharacterized protein n=1 Tax=Anguilla anguilla TaxID=7936 RepID=A0A0E9SH46_ANGAN
METQLLLIAVNGKSHDIRIHKTYEATFINQLTNFLKP